MTHVVVRPSHQMSFLSHGQLFCGPCVPLAICTRSDSPHTLTVSALLSHPAGSAAVLAEVFVVFVRLLQRPRVEDILPHARSQRSVTETCWECSPGRMLRNVCSLRLTCLDRPAF